MKALGIESLLLTNAAGGANTKTLKPGNLMIITDHINLMGVNPLMGPNDERFGPRFPDQTNVYNKDIIELISTEMKALNIESPRGVYLAFTGPSYETPAEVRMASIMGGDALGMSTIPEAMIANHCGIKVGGISCICNYAAGISPNPLSHKEVVETANMVKEDFKKLVGNILQKL